MEAMRLPMERFLAFIQLDGECEVWTGAKDKDGYPLFQLGTKRTVRGGRWFWEQIRGPIPAGMQVLHTCDNPPCLKLKHLFLGTSAENNHDRDRKNRTSKGEKHYNARLSDAQTAEIRARRAAGERPVDLAKVYGVTRGHISNLTRGRQSG